jgi:hypothetical protein
MRSDAGAEVLGDLLGQIRVDRLAEPPELVVRGERSWSCEGKMARPAIFRTG